MSNSFKYGPAAQDYWSIKTLEKLSGPVPKNGRFSVSARKLLNPGEYQQKVESVRVPKNCPDQYEKW